MKTNNSYSYKDFDTIHSHKRSSGKMAKPELSTSVYGLVLTIILLLSILATVTGTVLTLNHDRINELSADVATSLFASQIEYDFNMNESVPDKLSDSGIDNADIVSKSFIDDVSFHLADSFLSSNEYSGYDRSVLTDDHNKWVKTLINTYCSLYLESEINNALGNSNSSDPDMTACSAYIRTITGYDISESIKTYCITSSTIISSDNSNTELINKCINEALASDKTLFDKECDVLDDYIDKINSDAGANTLSLSWALRMLIGGIICMIISFVFMYVIYEHKFRALRNYAIAFAIAALPASLIAALEINLSAQIDNLEGSDSLRSSIEAIVNFLALPIMVTTSLLIISFFVFFILSRIIKKREK